mgnify:CR=1 FL=1
MPRQDQLLCRTKERKHLFHLEIHYPSSEFVSVDSVVGLMERTNASEYFYRMRLNSNSQLDGIINREPVQISTYTENEIYDCHNDTEEFPKSPPVRKVSCSVLLNDAAEFTGGGMQIRAWNEETINLTQGQGLFFASYFQHRVLPITEGMRKSMVIWYNGPAFK